jgi:hypothetical protein
VGFGFCSSNSIKNVQLNFIKFACFFKQKPAVANSPQVELELPTLLVIGGVIFCVDNTVTEGDICSRRFLRGSQADLSALPN